MALNWANALFSAGLGIGVGLIVMTAGLWIDRVRARKEEQ